jgi:L-2-hydroxyglutarate oxidase LhgO
MVDDAFDCIVVGAGVIGLAIARTLQLAGKQVCLIEKERQFGTATSSRNSEVIHAGIYYEPGSLKATWCVRGRHLLYEYCERRHIPHRRIGKLLVAVNESESPKLAHFAEVARHNDVTDLQPLTKRQVAELEPAVVAYEAILSPSTGIIDSHAYMQSLLHEFEMAGGIYVCHTRFVSAGKAGDQFYVEIDDGARSLVRAHSIINAAGHHATEVARSIEGYPTELAPDPHYAIGHYFSLAGASPFRKLIYPMPVAGGLGVHATLDLSGRAKFGPDVSWRDKLDYTFDKGRVEDFVKAIKPYFPAIEADKLIPDYTGIRPKIAGPENPNADFVLQDETKHGLAGLINLFGIESPGLTASLAIAESISMMAPFSTH